MASDTPVNHTEGSNSYSWGSNTVYAASSIGYMGAEWSSERHAWAFTYRFVGTGSARFGDSKSYRISPAVMKIKGESNISNMAMWSSADTKYIGSAPETSGSNQDYSFAESVIGFAITAINNLGVSYFWSTLGLINALQSNVDSVSDTGDSLFRRWDWSSYQSDVGQFFWFIVDVEPNQTVQISSEYIIFGPTYDALSAGKSYRNLIAPGPGTMTNNSEDWNPGMMSDGEKKKYGIEEIPRKEFDKRTAELNISSRSIEEFKNSDEEVFYYAHNLTEYAVEKEAGSPKEALMEEINIQRERSELIVEVFSSRDNRSNEDQRIIEKHKLILVNLEDLFEKAQSISEDATSTIIALQKKLRDDILKETPDSQSK